MGPKSLFQVLAKVGVPALALLFLPSCSWECQGISEEDLPWFIAEDYKCQAVLFTNGKDTVSVTYNSPEITHEMDKTFATERGCRTVIRQDGVGNAWRIGYDMAQEYIKNREESGWTSFYTLICCGESEYCRLLIHVDQALMTSGVGEIGSRKVARFFNEWESARGDRYQNVLKVWYVDQATGAHFQDTVYYAVNKGLVQLDWVLEGETWCLIPPEETGAGVVTNLHED